MKLYVLDGRNKAPRLTGAPPAYRTAVALGFFDGVHLGHRALLEDAVRFCAENNNDGVSVVPAAWTFAEPPSRMNGSTALKLTSAEDKLALFADCGIRCAAVEDFGRVRDYSCGRFFDEIILGQLRASLVVCGYNFRFGAGGTGDADTLKALASERGIKAHVIAPVSAGGVTVSSTAIREYLRNGAPEAAARLLGRPYSIDFPVAEGKKLGRTIGIPTINQEFPDGFLIPARGIYAVTVELGDAADGDGRILWLGAANIGCRPTVSGSGHINCETHIIGYNGWLYGKNIRVSFYKKLRDERRFATIGELRTQVLADIENVKLYFGDK